MIWYCLGYESRIERGRLHFHCQDALCTALCDHSLRLPKRRPGRPARSDMQGDRAVVPVCADHLSPRRIQVAVCCGKQIVVARPLAAQGPLPASTCETETYKPGHDTWSRCPANPGRWLCPLRPRSPGSGRTDAGPPASCPGWLLRKEFPGARELRPLGELERDAEQAQPFQLASTRQWPNVNRA